MAAQRICFIFGAGEHHDPPPPIAAGALVVAADGGYAYLARHRIPVDLLVGDFDSLAEPPEGVHTLALPKEKDDTDMMAAIRAGMARGCRVFHLYGGTGGRLDHTFANVQCLAYLAEQGARGFLFGREDVVTAIRDGEVAFPGGTRGTVSVFAHSETAQGVYETGLAYALSDATLHNTHPLGVSNAFIGQPSAISVWHGTLVIVYPKHVREEDPQRDAP